MFYSKASPQVDAALLTLFLISFSFSALSDTFFRHVVIDLERDGSVTAFNDQDSWEGTVDITDTEVTAGDKLIIYIKFTNDKSLFLSNPDLNPLNTGNELTKVTLKSDHLIGNDWRATGSYQYIAVDGDILSNPTSWSIGGGGSGYVGPFHHFNLTDNLFSYNGVAIEIDFTAYTCRQGSLPCVFNSMEWSSSAEDVQIVDAIKRAVNIRVNPGKKTALKRLNIRRKKLNVAVLTEGTFDALQLDPETIKFGPLGAAPIKVSTLDINQDGNTDLFLSFDSGNTGINCSDTSANLTGNTFGGVSIEGIDFFVIEKCSLEN